jgi:hypothetical protein
MTSWRRRSSSLGTVGVAPAILDLSISAQVLDDLLEEEIPIPGDSGRGSCHPGHPDWAYLPGKGNADLKFFVKHKYLKGSFWNIILLAAMVENV